MITRTTSVRQRSTEMTGSDHHGRCACGATTYVLTEAPKFSYLYQCHQCQKATGAGHAALFMVSSEALDIDGPLRFFEQRSDNGNVVGRGFCGECGSPILLRTSGYTNLVFLTAGSLEDADAFHPTQVLWHSQARPWDMTDSRLKINDRGV